MNKKTAIKLLLPLVILLVINSGFSYVYTLERDDIEKGETKLSLSYGFYFKNEGPINLTSISLRLAILKSWEPYQIVDHLIINTKPNRTTEDEYNNNFAWYEFENFEVGREIELRFDVNITLKFLDYSTFSFDEIIYENDDPLYRLYTAFDPLVDTTDPRIIDVANKFQSSSEDILGLSFEAYNFTSNFLSYKLLSTSKGAGFAISNGYGDCDEYQNLFMALVRSLGIPAIGHTAWLGDFIPGTSSTDEGAFAHAFPMFYVPNVGMISADPTRGRNSIYDNWAKTDDKRITMTQGPNHPYRLLNYKWIPQEGLDNPSIVSNYTISVHSSETEFISKVRSLILYEIIVVPIIFMIYNLVISKKVKREQVQKLERILNPKL